MELQKKIHRNEKLLSLPFLLSKVSKVHIIFLTTINVVIQSVLQHSKKNKHFLV